MSITSRVLPIFLCLAATSARAETVVVVPLCEGARMREATDTLAIYESDHGRSTRLVPTSATDAKACIVGLASDRAAMLKLGRSRFDALEFDEATRTLNALVDSFERFPALDGDLGVLIEARAYLAWAARERKDEVTARAQLKAACVLSPTFTLDANRFPPAVVSLAAKTCQEPAQTGVVDVTGVSAGAHVRVDDIERCDGPCSLTIPAGEHFVSIRRVGNRDDVKVDVAARVTARVDIAADLTVAERMRDAIIRSNALAVGRDFPDSDGIIVLLDERPEGIGAWTTRPPFLGLAGPTLLIDARHPADGGKARAAVDTIFATLPPTVAPPVAQARVSSEPLYKRWWLWAGLGAVAAGTATAIILATSHGNGDDVGVRVRLP